MACKQTLTEAFRKFGAEPINRNWSVSAISANNELVVSCWNHKDYLFKKSDALVYRDRLSRWQGSLGNDRLKLHLIEAWDRKLPVRLIQSTPDDPDAARAVIENGGDASAIKKHFHAREDLIGSFTSFEDHDLFVFEFRKK
jgi:hypothetical protein